MALGGRPIWIWLIVAVYGTTVALTLYKWWPIALSELPEYRNLRNKRIWISYYGFQIQYLVVSIIALGLTLRVVAIFALVLMNWFTAAISIVGITVLNVLNDGSRIYRILDLANGVNNDGAFIAGREYGSRMMLFALANIALSVCFGIIVVLYLLKLARRDRAVDPVFE